MVGAAGGGLSGGGGGGGDAKMEAVGFAWSGFAITEVPYTKGSPTLVWGELGGFHALHWLALVGSRAGDRSRLRFWCAHIAADIVVGAHITDFCPVVGCG